MELTEILRSQSTRLFRAFNPTGSLYLPDVISRIKEKYEFVVSPVDASGYLSGEENVLIFKHGLFNGKVIDEFKIYNDGVVVDTRAFVEDADAFIDDLIDWSTEQYGYSIKEYPPVQKMFTSQLEVKMDINLDKWIDRVKILASRINESLRSSGIEAEPFQVAGFTMHFDTSKYGTGAPSSFTIERRVQQLYESNLYFTTAPTLTSDHLKILETLEEIAKT